MIGSVDRTASGRSIRGIASDRLFESIVASADDAILAETLDGSIISWNAAAERLYGYRADEMIGTSVTRLVPPDCADETPALLERLARGERIAQYVTARLHKDGHRVDLSLTLSPIVDPGTGRVIGASAIARDLGGDRKRLAELETRLVQAERLEAIGRLAGGIAHDFNNILTTILGNAAIAQDAAEASEREQAIADIDTSARRAADLTQQLLAFARRQVLRPVVIDLNEVVRGMTPLLTRLIGEHINVEVLLAPGPVHVEADPTQLSQVLLNLAANARDSMPDGGYLSIATSTLHLDDGYRQRHPYAAIGAHGCLSVSDTGVGMDEHVRQHAFDPFFTTRRSTGGTGLGLATVYGIVKQSGGTVEIYSEPGMGTTFKVLLPLASSAPEPRVPESRPPPAPLDGQVVLLVEDDEHVRAIAARALTEAGLTVELAADGTAAREALGRLERLDLLLTDVVLGGGISGGDVAALAGGAFPGVRVLFVSGYPEDMINRHSRLASDTAFLSKPFDAASLVQRVHELIAARAPAVQW